MHTVDVLTDFRNRMIFNSFIFYGLRKNKAAATLKNIFYGLEYLLLGSGLKRNPLNILLAVSSNLFVFYTIFLSKSL